MYNYLSDTQVDDRITNKIGNIIEINKKLRKLIKEEIINILKEDNSN